MQPYVQNFLGIGNAGTATGGLATDQALFDAVSDRNAYRIDDLESTVTDIRTQTSAFFQFLTRFRKGPAATQPKYTWVRDDIPQIMSRVTAAANSSATTIYVVDGSVFQQGMLVLNQRTSEIMEVDRATSQSLTQITITSSTGRGMLGTTAQAILAGDILIALGVPLGERGTSTEGNFKVPTFDWNYVSFFSTKTSVTELQQVTPMRYGIDFPNAVKDMWFKLHRQVAMMLVFSRKWVKDGGTGVGRMYFMDGLIPQIKTNRLDLTNVDGVLTWGVFNNFLNNLAAPNVSSARKACFCGNNLFEAINTTATNKMDPAHFEPSLGTRIMTVVSSQGVEMDCIVDPYVFFGWNAGTGVVCDMNFIEYKEMSGFPWRVRPNIQANNVHYREDEIYGSASLLVKNEECSGLITGVSQGT